MKEKNMTAEEIMAELAGLRKAEVEQVKHFITKQKEIAILVIVRMKAYAMYEEIKKRASDCLKDKEIDIDERTEQKTAQIILGAIAQEIAEDIGRDDPDIECAIEDLRYL
jgi:hypothetical protein